MFVEEVEEVWWCYYVKDDLIFFDVEFDVRMCWFEELEVEV